FSDGDLVICAHPYWFRVHRRMLESQSSEFARLLAIPWSMVNGVTCVNSTKDSGPDFYNFLAAVYHHENFPDPPARVDFSVVESVLRVAHKYGAAAMRSRALAHLMAYSDLQGDLLPIDATPRLGAMKAIAALAREVGALWILPEILYEITCFAPDQIENANAWSGASRSLSHADRVAVGNGHRRTRHLADNPFRTLIAPERDCPERKCRKWRKELCKTQHRSFFTDPKRCVDWKSPSREDVRLKGMCHACRRIFKREWTEFSFSFWQALPERFDLPGWEELDDMREKDIRLQIEDTSSPANASHGSSHD
ncbi:hypothetical protein BD626DRAFT_416553, partial [Schizophyllum amplum]